MSGGEPERRSSIWSVPERWLKLFFAIFSLQMAGIMGLAFWYEIFVVTSDSWPESIFTIGSDAGPAIGVIAAESIILTEAYYVVIFGGIVEKYQNRLKQREAEGEARGVAKNQRKWESWNQRRLEAEAKGQPFDEPPPSSPPIEEKEGG